MKSNPVHTWGCEWKRPDLTWGWVWILHAHLRFVRGRVQIQFGVEHERVQPDGVQVCPFYFIGAVKVLGDARVCPSTMWRWSVIVNHSINVKCTQ